MFRYGHIKKTSENKQDEIIGYTSRTEVLLDKESEAQLSLQTSALVLPENIMNGILQKLNEIYSMKCFISKKFIKYV